MKPMMNNKIYQNKNIMKITKIQLRKILVQILKKGEFNQK